MSATTVARSSALGLATVVVERALALVGIVALGRLLPAESFGLWAFVVAYLAAFQVLADPGLESVLLRRLAQPGADRARLLGAGLVLRASLAGLAGLLAVALAPLAGGAITAVDGRLVVACAAAALLLQGQPGFRALLRSDLRIATVFAVAAGSSMLVLAATVLAAANGYGLPAIFLAVATAQALGLVAAGFAAGRGELVRPRIDPALWADLLREAWPIGANVLVVTLGLRMGALLLMRTGGPAEVGYYSSAMRLTESLNLIADGAMLTVFPLLARRAFTAPLEMVTVARTTARGLAIAVLVAILAIAPLAPDLLGRLFRPEFASAAPALIVASWSALLAALGTLYGGVLVASGRQRVLLGLNAVATACLVALQGVLVPRFGMVGAASASLVVSAASHLALAVLPGTRAVVAPCLRAAAGPVGCALALLLAARFLPGPPLLRAAGLVCGFPLLLLATGQIGRGEFAALGAALGGRPTP
jgi:O-antigen/teichoic acid export membrane protein